ncbi:MAG TPA: isoprenyl transferase [Thermodesulfobacteriota bacterium]|nr:isoprenyl transferase [Thermodesulfobacteriota bacterium]
MKGKLESLIDREKLPLHVAIIMDGNGRWAKNKNLDRISGHREGMKSVRAVVTAAKDLGIRYITLYAFSAQNWQRPKNEVDALMELLKHYLLKERDKLIENGIRLNAIGRLDELPQAVSDVLRETMEMTRDGREMTLTLALSYGGREEIMDAIKKIIAAGNISSEFIDHPDLSRFLYTEGMPEPDLLIRTSGEMRLSNFMLWQIAYAEIYVTRTLWPNFRKRHLVKAILNYQNRERRFGLTGEQLKKREAI